MPWRKRMFEAIRGTGNSVPEYVPDDNCFAMIRAVVPGGSRA
ncbi:hypothetical protein [Victivallis vadensis]|nr:hypothetical protein [Victivallis vadensis]